MILAALDQEGDERITCHMLPLAHFEVDRVQRIAVIGGGAQGGIGCVGVHAVLLVLCQEGGGDGRMDTIARP
ncbi:hypothetical protein D3C81_1914380 [compost metagenome]